jgi:hypothetical protein
MEAVAVQPVALNVSPTRAAWTRQRLPASAPRHQVHQFHHRANLVTILWVCAILDEGNK